MQQVCKIEQPTSPPSSLSQSQPITTPNNLHDLMQIINKLLLEGKESAQIINSFINERLGLKVEDHDRLDLVHHSLVTLNSLENTLSIIKSYDFNIDDVNRKRKLDSTNIIACYDHIKVEDPSRVTVSKERRGCYKRRRDGQTWTKNATDLVDDGHAWRKYGQKEILGTNYPRNYYRCTHKHDQHCQATKQVQQVSENPNKYNIIYNGQHTCKNLQTTSSYIIDPQEDSSNLLSFGITQNYPNPKLNSSSFFPSSTFLNNNHAMVKQEYTSSIKNELPISSQSEPQDLDHDHHSNNMQSSSCSENLPTSSDLTSSTPLSDQADSYAFDQFYDDFRFYNMDHIPSLDELLMNC